MNDNVLFQNILDELVDFFPETWENIIFYGECGEASYSYEYYVGQGNGQYVKCFDLEDVSQRDLAKAFMQVGKIVKEYRATLTEKELWTNMTLTIHHTGKFKADFDYTDLSEQGYEYKEAWKAKYLR